MLRAVFKLRAIWRAESPHSHLRRNISLIFRIGNLSAGIQASFLQNPEGLAYLFLQRLPRVGFAPLTFRTIPATCSDKGPKSGRLRVGISGRFASEWVAGFRRNTRPDSLGICTRHLKALKSLWDSYEIMGVSLVDMHVWNWLYRNPDSTPAQLKEAVISISVA